jgi:hypothetical protein
MTVVHILRQQRQTPLNIGKDLALKAATNFFQRENKLRQFVGRNSSIQGKPIKAAHFGAYRRKCVQLHRVARR